MDQHDGRTLLDRARDGDAAARGELIRLSLDRVRGAASGSLRARFPRVAAIGEETTDVLQDAFLRLDRWFGASPGRVPDSGERLDALTLRVVTRLLIDRARRIGGRGSKRRRREEIDPTHPLLSRTDGLDRWRTRAEVQDLIERLEEPERRIIRLALESGEDFAALGRALGMSYRAAYLRYRNARIALGRLARERADRGV